MRWKGRKQISMLKTGRTKSSKLCHTWFVDAYWNHCHCARECLLLGGRCFFHYLKMLQLNDAKVVTTNYSETAEEKELARLFPLCLQKRRIVWGLIFARYKVLFIVNQVRILLFQFHLCLERCRATLTTKRSITPASNIISTGTLESNRKE